MSDLFVGQKVVRIQGPPRSKSSIARIDVGGRISIGAVYEIRWIGMFRFLQADGSAKEEPACRLKGLVRCTQSPTNQNDVQADVPFAQILFRPVQEVKEEKKSDISIFRKIAQDIIDGKVVEIADA